jgi:hypothetical protein
MGQQEGEVPTTASRSGPKKATSVGRIREFISPGFRYNRGRLRADWLSGVEPAQVCPAMPFMDGHSLLIILVLLAGSGLFLRVVAKEKRRREKHLEYRLIERMQVLEERRRQAEWEKQREAKVAQPAALADELLEEAKSS